MDITDLLQGVLGGGPATAPRGGGDDLVSKLLPLVLQMLQGGTGGGAAGAAPGGTGGPGGLAGLGGLGGLVNAFAQNGLGDVVGSWIGRSQNLPVSGDQLAQVLGPGALGHLAGSTGASHAEVSDALSQLLPHVVDRLTPEGTLPEQGLVGDAGDLLKQLGLSPG